MRRSWWILLMVGVLVGCKPSVPSEYIQPDDLEDLLYDYHVAQAMARNQRGGVQENIDRTGYYLAVLDKHGVTEAEFDSSLVYYYSHADYLKKVYRRVSERLSADAKGLGASVGDFGQFSQFSASGDTANVWKDATDALLTPLPTQNRFDFSLKADTSFHQGDSFMMQFMSDFLWQGGTKDAVVCVVARYEGDSITQTINHVSMVGRSQVRIPLNREGTLKQLSGYVYLTDPNADDNNKRRLMFISQIQLLRFRAQEPKEPALLKVDSATIAPKDSVPAKAMMPAQPEPLIPSRREALREVKRDTIRRSGLMPMKLKTKKQ